MKKFFLTLSLILSLHIISLAYFASSYADEAVKPDVSDPLSINVLCNFKGRIGYSADGNQHDPDDWAANALALTQIWAVGLQDRLVHFDYNSHWGGGKHQNNPAFAENMRKSSDEVAKKLGGFNLDLFFDNQKNFYESTDNIARAVNASSAENPFILIVAGPMHIPYTGLNKAEPAKLKYVKVISHGAWNNEHSHETKTWSDIKNLGNGIKTIKIANQNVNLGLDALDRFDWLQGKGDALQYVYERLAIYQPPSRAIEDCKNKQGCTDVSDSGMVYYVISGGKQDAGPDDIRNMVESQKDYSCDNNLLEVDN